MKKRLMCLFLMLFLFACPARALEAEPQEAVPDAWQEVIDAAPMTAREFADLSFSQMANSAWSAFLDMLSAPLRLLAKMCGMLLVVAVGRSLCAEKSSLGTAALLDTVAALAVFSLASSSILGLMGAMQAAVESSRSYLAAFIPVFSSVLASCGQAGSAVLYNGLFLSVANLIAGALCGVGFPATRIFLALTATAAVGSTLDLSALAGAVCKWSKWLLTLCATVFGTVLTLQSAFAQSADSLALKTGKFLLSSSIPVVGRAVSDAMGGVLAGVKLLKGSVGFAAVAALAAVFLPLILQCVVYQLVFSAGGMVAAAVDDPKSAKLLGGLSDCVGLYLSMAFFFCFMVLSATVLMILLGNGG